jgi:hypothetical protein
LVFDKLQPEKGRTARVIFCVTDEQMVLVHSFTTANQIAGIPRHEDEPSLTTTPA